MCICLLLLGSLGRLVKGTEMAFFGPQLSPMVKAVKFSLKQIDAMSKGSYTFVCCARSERGKLALLHVTDAPPGSTGRVNDNAAQAMKRLFEAVSTNNSPVERDRLPSSAGTEPAVAGPLSVSASARSSGTKDTGSVTAAPPAVNRSATTLGRSADRNARSRPASLDGGVSFHGVGVAAELPCLPPDIGVPELVGGGFDFEADVPGDRRVQRTQQDARASAVLAHRERLDALTARQKAEVPIGDDIVASVRLKLCCGKSRRLLLADLFVFYELLAHYCKQHLNLTQVVYQHLAPIATLGISVKLVVSQMSPSRKPRPSVVSLKMVNRSKLRVPVGFLSFAIWCIWRTSSSSLCWTRSLLGTVCLPRGVLVTARGARKAASRPLMAVTTKKRVHVVTQRTLLCPPADHMVSVAARLVVVTAQQETLAGRLKRVAARLETVAARLKRAAGLLESVAARLVRAVTRLVLVPLRQEAVAARLVLVPALLEAAAVRLGRMSARLAWTAAQLKMVAARLVPAAACLLMVAAQLVPVAARLVPMEAWLVTVAEGVALVAACLVTVRAWMVPVAASQEMVATRLVPAGACL